MMVEWEWEGDAERWCDCGDRVGGLGLGFDEVGKGLEWWWYWRGAFVVCFGVVGREGAANFSMRALSSVFGGAPERQTLGAAGLGLRAELERQGGSFSLGAD